MFFIQPSIVQNNYNLALLVNLLIYTSLLIIIPIIFTLVLSFIKPKLSNKYNFYLYSFSSGMLLMIGTVGLLGDGINEFKEYIFSLTTINETSKNVIVPFTLCFTIIFGSCFVLLIRYLFVKKFGEMHIDHSHHSHNEHIFNENEIENINYKNKKQALLVILLLLSHRIIDGFVLGANVAYITSGSPFNVGFLVIFNIHILFEVVIIYYRQVQYGTSKKKAILFTIGTIILIVPIMFIGAYLNKYLNNVGWLLPLFSVGAGSLISFVSIIELAPEFIHLKKADNKIWYKTLILFILGIAISIALISLHQHPTH